MREFCLYGETTGRLNEEGFPERLDWAADYAGAAAVVHGHVAVNAAVWRNNVLNLDTGCVFGGSLSVLRLAGAGGRQRAGSPDLLRTRGPAPLAVPGRPRRRAPCRTSPTFWERAATKRA